MTIIKQYDRICLNCNKGFNFNQLKEKREISFYQLDICPYCNSMNHVAGLFEGLELIKDENNR